MKNYEVFTGKYFNPLFPGAKAELITLKGSDGGPQAIAQFYDENMASKVASILEASHKEASKPLTSEEIAVQIGKLINSTSARPFLVGEEIALREHRFLQQEFWTLVEGFVKQSARNFSNRYYDDRNAYAVKMCRRIEDMLDKWRQEIANERL